MKRLFFCFLTLALLLCMLSGCQKGMSGETSQNGGDTENNTAGDTGEPVSVDFSKTDADMFTARDLETEYEENDSILIRLNGDSATASSDSVKIVGSTVTITEDATHILSGTLTDGTIVVDAPDTAKLQLVLNGVHIKSEHAAALYILSANKVFVTVVDGTENTLENGGSFTPTDESNVDAAVFSKQDLTFNGSGNLAVISPAGHGIVSKDDLVLTGGTYTITCASHGLDVNNSVRITGASLTVNAGKDGIHAEKTDDTTLGFVYVSGGSLDIECEGDGISAANYLQIEDGSFHILAGGGSANGQKQSSDSWGGFMGGGKPGQHMSSSSQAQTETEDSSTSMKALKAVSGILVNGGDLTLDSADDAVHTNASLTVNGGTFDISSGDDGFHADETLTVTGGLIRLAECYEGLEALHIDIRGGDISLIATDDGLNVAGGTDQSGGGGRDNGMFGGGPMGGSSSSSGSITISGGTLNVLASGDGIDANGTLAISGGQVTVGGPIQGDTATLDYDTSGTITGGTFIGTGASGMAQTFSDATQGVIAVNVGSQSAQTAITLTDKNGTVILSHQPELPFAVVILSSPDIVTGDTYTLSVGSISKEVTAS